MKRMLLTLTCAILIGCQDASTDEVSAAERLQKGISSVARSTAGMVEDATSTNGSQWSVATTKDPFTDVEVSRAVRNYRLPSLDVEVTIRCKKGTVGYQFAGFKHNGKGAPYNFEISGAGTGTSTTVTLRMDGGEPEERTALLGKYANSIQVGGAGFLTPAGENLINARQLLVKLDFATDEAVLRIDQTDPGIATFMSDCKNDIAALAKSNRELQIVEDRNRKALSEENEKYNTYKWPKAAFQGHGTCTAELDGATFVAEVCSIQSSAARIDDSGAIWANGTPPAFHGFKLRLEGGNAHGLYSHPTKGNDLRTGPLTKAGKCWEGGGTRFCVYPDRDELKSIYND